MSISDLSIIVKLLNTTIGELNDLSLDRQKSNWVTVLSFFLLSKNAKHMMIPSSKCFFFFFCLSCTAVKFIFGHFVLLVTKARKLDAALSSRIL